jgi:guanine deaminase
LPRGYLSPTQGELSRRAYRGAILHALSADELAFFPDGGLIVNEAGRIEACDGWEKLLQGGKLQGVEILEQAPGGLIVPGFVDMHVHLPQMEVAGCQEKDLLSWLDRHIFPAEAQFAEPAHAQAVSQWFFEALLANGTTTAAVFLTSHPEATQIAFETAERLGNRVVMGQNLMDCHAPSTLIRPTGQLLEETEALCRQWHGRDDGRIQYAWVPRFALTSTEALLKGIGQLRKRLPQVYLHTHLSEQSGEIAAVKQQFPWATDYTQVYEQFGLLGHKSILAHGIHLSSEELDRIKACDASLAHCPSSNFFLKSGRFKLMDILARGMRLGLGSDVGAGPELSMLKVMKDAQYMQADTLISPQTLFYLATLGGAKGLCMADRIGNFEPGKEADFIVLNQHGKPGITRPENNTNYTSVPESIEQLLSRPIYLGDERWVMDTYIRGRQCHSQNLASVQSQ